jgi:hypothetical protein
MSWSEMPLLKYEAELFVHCSSWKSIEELEECLTLEEMFTLYRASKNEFSMMMKSHAMAAGAEVDWDEDWYDPPEPPKKQALHGSDIKFLPIGLGFEQG